jgi:2-polyprenyl-6-methoxyphenol hydroxylase-like FAD-dependent oxidoreductase
VYFIGGSHRGGFSMNEQILVVGAGPVGLTMAMALKRRGVEVRIVDKAATPTDKSKALVIWPRTLELLDIQGCAATFIETGSKAVGARILADGKVLVQVDLHTSRSIYRYALMIAQSETERLLGDQLALLGVQVERSVELTSFVDDGNAISAVLRHADGHEETVRASYLAACDGAHSTVRHALGSQFEGDTMPSGWVLADLEIDGEIPRDQITIGWTPDGVLAFFPIAGSRFRIIADVGLTKAGDGQPPTLQSVQALVDKRAGPGLRVHDEIWLSNFSINERKVKDYRRGRVFLAGDAAHVHSPAGGQGMNTGMQDAFNLAWKLSMVWHGDASPTLLDSYSPERGAIGEQVLRGAGNMTKVALLRNPILREIRNLAAGALSHVAAVRQHLVDQLTEMDLHYRDSPLTFTPHGAAHHPAGGERAPDVPLTTASGAATRLHEILATGKFVVLSVAVAGMKLPEPLRSIATAIETGDASDYEAGHVYLIRPDAYVSMSAPGDNASTIVTALERIATHEP